MGTWKNKAVFKKNLKAMSAYDKTMDLIEEAMETIVGLQKDDEIEFDRTNAILQPLAEIYNYIWKVVNDEISQKGKPPPDSEPDPDPEETKPRVKLTEAEKKEGDEIPGDGEAKEEESKPEVDTWKEKGENKPDNENDKETGKTKKPELTVKSPRKKR